jgi:hypothetical protein
MEASSLNVDVIVQRRLKNGSNAYFKFDMKMLGHHHSLSVFL